MMESKILLIGTGTIMELNKLSNSVIGIIGLGYVGLPLAVAFSKKYDTVGFDIDQSRVKELNSGIDSTNEVEKQALLDSNISFTCEDEHLRSCNIFIITVPTPVDNKNRPDLTMMIEASKTIGAYLKKGDMCIYECTVYPGATEEVCIPVLERSSNLILNKDFYVGYSPERINPGDKEKTVTKITKVTSGSCPEALDVIDTLYSSVIEAGTHKAPSIKVAEAAKVIENTQRDVNIALMNELSTIFDLMQIKTSDVLNAARTKWNFLDFKPGLVGGHCIGVDPYYLAYKAEELGHMPEIILAGRRINESVPNRIASRLIKDSIKSKLINSDDFRVLILGATFKENCPDIRNSKVKELIDELKNYSLEVGLYDPFVSTKLIQDIFCATAVDIKTTDKKWPIVIMAVNHSEFIEPNENLRSICEDAKLLYDLKSVINYSKAHFSL
jgi:UDP-N-acetyl-D-galactosamine dehydrogenase